MWRRSSWFMLAMILLLSGGCGGNDRSAGNWMEEGINRFQAGKYGEAVSAYLRAAEQEPRNPLIHNLLGMAYRFQFNTTGRRRFADKETKAFRRAVELNPRFLAAVKNLAATLHRDGDDVGAAQMAKRALGINPNDPERAILQNWIDLDTFGKEGSRKVR